MSGLRVMAHGGGVRSTALLVLSAQGKVDYPTHLFSNVGDDSEHPATLEYVRTVSRPFAEAHGIELIELHRTLRDGTPETLLGRVMKENTPSIPVYLHPTGAPVARSCTKHFKVGVISKWLKANGASADNPATVGIGISVDEIERANGHSPGPWEQREYPLLELGLRRSDCHRIISDAGLPTPPKSACWFCPFHRDQQWAERHRDDPELFAKAVAVEVSINERRRAQGKNPAYLRSRGPLAEVGPAQDHLFSTIEGPGDDGCDEGVCFV